MRGVGQSAVSNRNLNKYALDAAEAASTYKEVSTMNSLSLSQSEAEILFKILEYHLSELRMEIAATDRMAFRVGLKERETVINRVLSVLSQLEGAAVS